MKFFQELAISKRVNNLESANQAIGYVKRTLTYGSGNLGEENTPNFISYDQLEKRYEATVGKSTVGYTHDSDLEKLIEISNFKTKLTETGNCGFQSYLAFEYLINHNIYPVELFEMQDGDHGFVVIGRNANTNPHNPMSWNKEAIICDPWSGESFPARELSYGLNLSEPAYGRKHALQTQGYLNLLCRKETEESEILDCSQTSPQQIKKDSLYLPELLSNLQSVFYKLFTQKELHLLDNIKSELMDNMIESELLEPVDINRVKIAEIINSYLSAFRNCPHKEMIISYLQKLPSAWDLFLNTEKRTLFVDLVMYGNAEKMFKEIENIYPTLNETKFYLPEKDKTFLSKLKLSLGKLCKDMDGNNMKKIEELIKNTEQEFPVSKKLSKHLHKLIPEIPNNRYRY